MRQSQSARGPVRGVARVSKEDTERIVDELERNGRSELKVRAELLGEDDKVVAEVDVDYAFRPHPSR